MMTQVACESWMRSTSALEENPPKTIVCGAPMRAQASMATGKLGRHAHVDGDSVAFLHAKPFQNVGELLHFAMQLLVGQDTDFAGLALPNDCGFILAPGGDVAIEAVVGEVDLAADKPFRPRAIPFENLVPLLEPVQFAGDPRPEFVRVVDRFLVEALVFFEALDVGLLAEFRGRFELALLVQDGIDIGGLGIDDGFIGHDEEPRRGGILSCR